MGGGAVSDRIATASHKSDDVGLELFVSTYLEHSAVPNRSSDGPILESIRLYRETLKQTEKLYVEGGELLRGSYGWLVSSEAENAIGIADQMFDLHQGLVMKVYAHSLPASRQRTLEQRQLGRTLLQHLWGEPVIGNQLKDAVDWLISEAEKFRWLDLLKPFAELPPLRDSWGQVNGVVIQMANLVCKADGEFGPLDQQHLKTLQNELDRIGGSAPERFPSDVAPQREALQWIRDEAARLRSGAATVERSHSHLPVDVESETPKPPSSLRPKGNSPASSQAAQTPSKSNEPEAPEDTRTPEEKLADAMAKLNRLVGLDNIKDQVNTLANFLKLENRRKEEGLPSTTPSLHMAFVGNPGTGKTTVARIVAEVFSALGVLPNGQLVETDRSGLVAEYAGQTGPKTNAKIDEALGGVLFVDEAYTLIDSSGQDQYGREAVQTLLKRMEDQREQLVVILAGYPQEMEGMIRSNPGLSSRVGTTMHFEDYSPVELAKIFELIAGSAKYTLPTEARRRLLYGFDYLYQGRDRHFGNGRCSRNSFERSVRRLANRIAERTDIDRQLLTTLEGEDIEVAGILLSHLAALAGQEREVLVTCDHCQATQAISDQKLGCESTCTACKKPFTPKWGSFVPAGPPQTATKGGR